MKARIDDRQAGRSTEGPVARLILLGSLAAVLIIPSQARAQFVGWPYYGPAYPAAGAPWCHYECFHHCSTVAESALTGWSRYYRAWGQANYLNALAATEYQRAYALALANRKVFLEPYLAAREAELAERALHTALRRREQIDRRAAALLEARELLPAVEATRGRLNWPEELRKPEHRKHLAVVSECLGVWAESYYLDTDYRGRLKRSLRALQTRLRRQQQFGEPTAELAAARTLLRKIDTLVFSEASRALVPPVTKVAQTK